MEKYLFEPFTLDHQNGVMDIFNYYVENSMAAYREQAVPKEKFLEYLENAKQYPGYAILNQEEKIIGYCMLEPYASYPTFSETVEITYFIDKDYTGKGIGTLALQKLENDAKNLGKKKIVANISSENKDCIKFHINHGFQEYGRLVNIGKKNGKYFSVVWVGKDVV